jgi:hypothetical protein
MFFSFLSSFKKKLYGPTIAFKLPILLAPETPVLDGVLERTGVTDTWPRGDPEDIKLLSVLDGVPRVVLNLLLCSIGTGVPGAAGFTKML